MKNFLLTIAVASCCVIGAQAQNTFNVETKTVDNTNDLKSFDKTPKMNGNKIEYQELQTKILSYQSKYFKNQFAVTANDLKNADGTFLPKGAKVTEVSLDGYNHSDIWSKGNNTFSDVQIWIENNETNPELNKELGFDNGLVLPGNDCLYTSGKTKSYSFDANSSEKNLTQIINTSFAKPFAYEGNDIVLTMYLAYQGDAMHLYYQKADAETRIATVFHTGNWAFSTDGAKYNGDASDAWVKKIIADFTNMSGRLEAYTIPAFKLKYYTNDIRVKVQNNGDNGGDPVPTDAYITLIDKTTGETLCDGNSEKATSSKTFENLDYTHTYILKVSNRFTAEKEVELNFGDVNDPLDAIQNDLDVVLTSKGTVTGVEDANVAKAVAGVKYYNLAGVESAEPFTGVNIVKTTYTDGSQSVAKKVIK